jgi:hypothetical protein
MDSFTGYDSHRIFFNFLFLVFGLKKKEKEYPLLERIIR